MKKSTATKLYRFLYSGGEKVSQDVDSIFDIYSNLEIRCQDDLFKDHQSFYELIKQNVGAFKKNERMAASILARRKIFSLKSFGDSWFYPEKVVNQEHFAQEIKALVDYNKDVRILEVGSGVIPYSSILLGKEGYNISSVDKFYLTSQCLKRLNVKSYRQLFNETFNLKNFDLVVGRRPCSAISSIVKSCTEHKVPYFIRLCACELPSNVRKIDSWQPILRRIDRNITFDGAYAYDFKNSKFGQPKNIEKIIEMDDDMLLV